MRPATDSDRAAIAVLLDEARAWLAEQGIEQWITPFSDDWLERTFAAGQWYLAERDHLPYAALRLLWTDAVFWGERERGDAAYVHTLMVRRDLAGQGLGTWALNWAGGMARTSGKAFRRLDCGQRNPRLVRYHRDHGFQPAGQVEVDGEMMQLLEKRLALVLENGKGGIP